jgi:Caspase domain
MKRALIIRSGFDTPLGARNSAQCMASLIAAYGFEVTTCEDDAASRDGILAAIGRLIAATRKCDAAVLYYVGHGGLVTNSQYVAGGPVPRYVQHLIPTDYGETTEDDFRGITAAELSRLLVRLSARSANTTAIWECCYASQLGRSDELLSEGERPKFTYLGLVRHYEKLRATDPALGRLDIAANPRVVRVAAADEFSSSYPVGLPPAGELDALGIACRGDDDRIGAMTLALARILAPLRGHRVAWKQVAPELRARLYIQRPEIEGPLDRVPFSLDVVDPGTIGVVLVRDGGAVVDAGALLGVSIGDVYGVMPAGATIRIG